MTRKLPAARAAALRQAAGTSANAARGGRLAGSPDETMQRINTSIDLDKRLYAQDIAGSLAHCAMLVARRIIAPQDGEAIARGLEKIHAEIEKGAFPFRAEHEDIHLNIEARLKELIGDAAGRLHTARSRNDQVATDFRLWVREAIDRLDRGIRALQEALIEQAEKHAATIMPGLTHLQNAQPVSFGHHLLAYVEMLGRDRGRLADARARLNESPLGSGALAGTSFPIDRDQTAKDLGFDRPTANSLDAVSDRDFALEFLAACAVCGTHLSRFAEEIVLWLSEPFHFIRLSDAFTTGSSMMPQKKNPDIAELARGKTGRLIGHLTALLATLKGLPLAYNRDLQEDKEPLFDAVDQVERSLEALRGLMATATFDTQAMARAADEPTLAATDLAEWLVLKGMPFRNAHELVGAVVRDSLQRRVPLVELVAANPALGSEATALLEPGVPVSRRTTPGGAGPVPVAAELVRFASALRTDAERFGMSRPAGAGSHGPRGATGGRHGAAAAAGTGTSGAAAGPARGGSAAETGGKPAGETGGEPGDEGVSPPGPQPRPKDGAGQGGRSGPVAAD